MDVLRAISLDIVTEPRKSLHLAAMVVKIRLARFGKRNSPFYNIVVAQARYGAHPESDS